MHLNSSQEENQTVTKLFRMLLNCEIEIEIWPRWYVLKGIFDKPFKA